MLPGNTKATGASPNQSPHTFSRSEVNAAVRELEQAIRKHFGSVWSPKSDGQYLGKSIDILEPSRFSDAAWVLCQFVRHSGRERAFGKVELREAGTLVRMIIFYGTIKDRE